MVTFLVELTRMLLGRAPEVTTIREYDEASFDRSGLLLDLDAPHEKEAEPTV